MIRKEIKGNLNERKKERYDKGKRKKDMIRERKKERYDEIWMKERKIW